MIKDIYKTTKFFQFTNVNPTGEEKGDCALRALAVALGISWMEAFDMMVATARPMYLMPNEVEVIDKILTEHGFKAMTVHRGKKRPTLTSLIKEYPNHIIVGRIAHHMATAKDGKVRDLWNSSERSLYKYWIKEEA